MGWRWVYEKYAWSIELQIFEKWTRYKVLQFDDMNSVWFYLNKFGCLRILFDLVRNAKDLFNCGMHINISCSIDNSFWKYW